MYKPRIAGITRVRNESLIIKETLDHFSLYCDAGIYVYDDKSDDDTVKICKAHPNVEGIIGSVVGKKAEWQSRQAIFDYANASDEKIDWFIYFDADERMYFDMDSRKLKNYDAISMMLFDFYITEEDKDRVYNGNLPMMRRLCGPEYRRIIMMFRNLPCVKWDESNQRISNLPMSARILKDGYVKHYGKVISDEACILSDFKRQLCTWMEIKDKAILLDK